MTTILILNAISPLIAAAGLTGAVAWQRRMARRRAQTLLVYVTERPAGHGAR
jgi:hypothetical protein